METWLKGIAGAPTGRTFQLDPERPTYFGSGNENTIILPGKGIARRAAMIVADRMGFHIYSLVSRSVLRINGQHIADASLSAGEMLTAGEHSFVVEQRGQERSRAQRRTQVESVQPARTEIVGRKTPYPTAYLYGISGELAGKAIPLYLNTTVHLGRGKEADIRFHSSQVSRKHARLAVSADSFLLTDDESANGTLVNDQSISSHRLRSGDEIILGNQTLRFEVLGTGKDDEEGVVLVENRLTERR